MKKIALVIFASLVFMVGYSQPGKAGWEIDGMAKWKWETQKYTYNDVTYKQHWNNFKLAPEVGYFFSNQFVAGLTTSFETWHDYTDDDEGYKTNEFNIGPYVKYYFMKPNEKRNFFVEAKYRFGGWKPNDTDERFNYSEYGFGLGMVCLLNRHVGLVVSFDWSSFGYEDSYYSDYEGYDDSDRSNKLGFCAGLQIYLDPCKKKMVTAR